MASATEIANLALSHLGVGKEISNIETDRGQEAQVCNRFYTICKELVLGDYSWPFATKFQTLALIEEDPNSEWAFSYRYPSDCLFFRRVLSGVRNDTRQSRVPYRNAYDSTGRIIFCDVEDAEAEYTINISDTTFFSPSFVMALSFRLATYIAPRITGGDPFKLGAKAMEMYMLEISKAKAIASNEEQAEEEVQSQFIRDRE